MANVAETFFLVLFLLALLFLAVPFGRFLARVYLNRPAFGDRWLLPVERAIYRLLGTSPRSSMSAREYAASFLLVEAMIGVWVLFVLAIQGSWFAHPVGYIPLRWDGNFHTAMSFLTATDFTHMAPEVNMTSWGMLLGLEVAMFAAPAAGLAVAAAMVRGFIRKDGTLGNFYVDFVRSLTRVVAPLAILGALILLLLSVPAALPPSLFSGGVPVAQGLPGPVAAFQSIVYVGDNGGSWTSANAVSALSNPSIWTSYFGVGLFFLLPLAFPFAMGSMVRRPGEAGPFIATMLVVFLTGLFLFLLFQDPVGLNPVGSRLGTEPTAFFQVASVYSNTGASNVAIGGLSPLAQTSLLFGMFTQATPGADGVGFATLLVFALVAVFVGGLMVGRTPEYLGKRVNLAQMKWAALVLLIHPALVLVPTAIAYVGGFVPSVSTGGFGSPGFCSTATCLQSHAFTSVLYEFASEAANNGSGMSFNDSTFFFNIAGGLVILLGRILPMLGMLAIGGEFARQDQLPPGPGTLRTQSGTFTLFLTLMVVIISALMFLPVLALGPLAQIGG